MPLPWKASSAAAGPSAAEATDPPLASGSLEVVHAPVYVIARSVSSCRPAPGNGRNDAVTSRAAVMLTTQVDRPEQSPVQPSKYVPVPGVAVSVTEVPRAKSAEQTEPQSMPA